MKSPCLRSVSGHDSGVPTRTASTLIATVFILLALAVLLGAAPTPRKKAAPTETDMMKMWRATIATSLRETVPRATTPHSTLNMVKRLSEERRTAHRLIGAEYPLTDFRGIVLADSYDESFIGAVDSVCATYLRMDDDLPSAAAGDLLSARLSDLPPVSDTPASFITAFLIMRCVQASLQLAESAPAGHKDEVPEVALRLMAGVTQKYRGSRKTFEGRQHSEELWHVAVLERVRCPTHSTPYTLKQERNGLRSDGSFYRRYVVACDGGGESRNLDFDLEAISAISRSGGRQQLPARIEAPASRQPGVDQ